MRRRTALLSLTLGAASQSVGAQAQTPRNQSAAIPSARFDLAGFDATRDPLPKGYRGHDIRAIYAALQRRPQRDSYEKTAEYEARLSQWESKPLYGSFMIADTLAVVVGMTSLSTKYDADQEVLQIHFSPEANTSVGDSDRPFLALGHSSKNLTPRVGQTAMGVKFQYTRRIFAEFGVRITNFDVDLARWTLTGLAPQTARQSSSWNVVFLGSLVDPFIFSDEQYHQPTLSARFEEFGSATGVFVRLDGVWVVHPADGRVVARLPLR